MLPRGFEPVVLQLPRNFLFFQRLPSRFSVLVLKAGNETAKGRWYQVEIQGQKLNLLSRIPLEPGVSVLVEKLGPFELKVVSPHALPSPPTATSPEVEVSHPPNSWREVTWQPETLLDLATLLILREWQERQAVIFKLTAPHVYHFSLPGEVALAGVFTGKSGYWRLYLLDIFSPEEVTELFGWLKDLGISQIHLLSEKELSRIGKGVDILG